jgi:lipoprotein-releasing system ATP-binding protein
MIIAENIHKFYERNHILKGINLKINEGEIVSLVGASGAGKTTLLQILGTIDSFEKNKNSRLILKNQNVGDFNEDQLSSFRNQEIGFVFQFHQLLPEFSVIENICIPAFIKKMPKKDAELKAAELIDYLGLSKRINNKPSELSGGEKQRVAVARALINSPSLILADEPSGNLDSSTSNNLHDLFNELRKDFKYTFVIATHDITLAKKSDRILKISDGIIK